MTKYTIHTIESAPEASKPLLERAQKQLGFIPNLFGALAEAPVALETYFALTGLVEKTSFSAAETEVINLSVSATNSCKYCLAAHSTISTMKKVPWDVIEAARAGTPIADPNLETLAKLTRNVVETHGWPEQELLDDFFNQGYTQANYLELIVGVTMKTLSNYVNHQVDTPIDAAFGGASKAS